MIECKTATTPVQSVSIKKDWLLKNDEERFAMNKDYSALAFDYGDGIQYYIIDESLFLTLITLLKEERR